MKTAGLILAAGESSRMGSPKALLTYRGETFLDRLIGLFAARTSPVIVVLGAGADSIRSQLARTSEARFVVNPDYIQGQITSLQCGLREVPRGTDAVLLTLVDHPAVEAATLTALTTPPAPLLRLPRFDGRRGHPLLIGRPLFSEFLAVPNTGSARDVVHKHLDSAEYLDTGDAGILADIDLPEQYQALIAHAAQAQEDK